MGHKYMSYSRDAGGLITRNHCIVTMDDGEISDYHNREGLMGWPESCVFWRFGSDGSAIGIAPMSEAVLRKITHYTAIDGFKLHKNNAVKLCTSTI